MTNEWDQLKRDCAQWIEPDALEGLMAGIKPGKVDNRTLLLELAHEFDRGSRLGRALRVMNDYRAPTGECHPMSSIVIIGSVRFMFEAGGTGESEHDLEGKLRRHLNPDVPPTRGHRKHRRPA